MPYIDKTRPSPIWTPDQLYKYDERLGIIGNDRAMSSRTGLPLLTLADYRVAWEQAEKWEAEK